MRWLHRALDFWRPPPPSGQHAWPAMVLPSERKGGTAHRACHTAVQPQRRATVRQACRLGAGRGWLCGLSLFIISSPSTPPSCLVISYRLWHGHLLIAFSFHFFCEAVCFLWLQLHIVRACQSFDQVDIRSFAIIYCVLVFSRWSSTGLDIYSVYDNLNQIRNYQFTMIVVFKIKLQYFDW